MSERSFLLLGFVVWFACLPGCLLAAPRSTGLFERMVQRLLCVLYALRIDSDYRKRRRTVHTQQYQYTQRTHRTTILILCGVYWFFLYVGCVYMSFVLDV